MADAQGDLRCAEAGEDRHVVRLRVPGSLYASLALCMLIGMIYVGCALLLLLLDAGTPHETVGVTPLVLGGFALGGGYLGLAARLVRGAAWARPLLGLCCAGSLYLGRALDLQLPGLLLTIPALLALAVLVLLFAPASNRFFAVLREARRVPTP